MSAIAEGPFDIQMSLEHPPCGKPFSVIVPFTGLDKDGQLWLKVITGETWIISTYYDFYYSILSG